MIALRPHPRGTILAVRVHPGARRAAVSGIHDGALKISVTAAAEKGRANEAVQRLLSEALGVARQQIELTSGPTSRSKQFLLVGLTAADVEQRLAAALAD